MAWKLAGRAHGTDSVKLSLHGKVGQPEGQHVNPSLAEFQKSESTWYLISRGLGLQPDVTVDRFDCWQASALAC